MRRLHRSRQTSRHQVIQWSVYPASDLEYFVCAAKESHQRFILFSLDMEARVGIFTGQTSMQDSDLEQVFPKCSA